MVDFLDNTYIIRKHFQHGVYKTFIYVLDEYDEDQTLPLGTTATTGDGLE